MIKRFFIAGVLISMLSSCLTPPDYDPVPKIEFDSLTKTYVQGFLVTDPPVLDSITFFISFTDGDGDLGTGATDTTHNLFFVDSRTGFPYPFQFPYVTPEGNVKDISGIISYTFSPFNCVPGHQVDTVSYTIYISDRAGHLSNEVTTPEIVIDCQQ